MSALACGCGSDTPASGGPATASSARGDPSAGKVSCVEASCDVTQGQKCCLWVEGNPIVERGACMSDCSMAPASPGTGADEISCDGAEDCAGSACCDGKCTTQAQCLPGPNQFCHETKECPTGKSCCDPLLIGKGRYGACSAPLRSECPWP